MDRLNVVLDELQDKGGKDLTIIKTYRKYIKSIMGINVDVSDTEGLWVRFQGWLTSEKGGVKWLFNIALFLWIIILGIYLSKAIKHFLKGKTTDSMQIFLNGVIQKLIIASGFLFCLSILGIGLGPVIALLGGLSVGIGFGSQALVNNWISGLILLFERTIKPGDVIEVNGQIAKVIKIGIRTITVQTITNIEMIVPNGNLLNNTVVNYTLTKKDAEFAVQVAIPYTTDLHKAYELITQACKEHKEVITSKIRLQDLCNGVIEIKSMISIQEPLETFKICHEVRTRIWELFKENNISIAYPPRSLYMQKDSPLETINEN
ncbi:MAG: mechanosensitive ion channel domain-containing protein [Spirochaetota bacterium]